MSINIIGLSAFYHDSACCLLQDGKLVAATEEERLTRRKHDPSLPVNAFLYCLEKGNISITEVDRIAFYENPQKKLSRQLWATLPDIPSKNPVNLFRYDATRVEREIRERLGFEGPIDFIDHHHSHAASSFYYSGFAESAVLTVDGVGEWATTTYGRGSDEGVEIFEEVDFPHSIGLLYSTITSYLGFKVNDAEYKVMGLAPYGKPNHKDKIYQLLTLDEGGQYRLNMEYFDFVKGKQMFSDKLVELFGRPQRVAESPLEPFHMDVAKSLQEVLEEFLLQKAAYLKTRVDSDNLCMAGGVALNCVANGRLLKEGPFKNIFVQPASSDAGSALGAAAVSHHRLTGERPRQDRLKQVFLGPSFDAAEVKAICDAAELDAHHCEDKREVAARTADYLAQGKVIGWYQGAIEFGPRALGARSILADPRGDDKRDLINASVKKRESFRPFAPAVLKEYTTEHFDMSHESPFMLETCQVASDLPLPAITHVDGSARVQTVDSQHNPLFAELLQAFNERTGCPILLNTSFNLRSEPIVLTPIDALLCFIRSKIDILVMENTILTRAQITPFLASMGEIYASHQAGQQSAVSEIAYTFI